MGLACIANTGCAPEREAPSGWPQHTKRLTSPPPTKNKTGDLPLPQLRKPSATATSTRRKLQSPKHLGDPNQTAGGKWGGREGTSSNSQVPGRGWTNQLDGLRRCSKKMIWAPWSKWDAPYESTRGVISSRATVRWMCVCASGIALRSQGAKNRSLGFPYLEITQYVANFLDMPCAELSTPGGNFAAKPLARQPNPDGKTCLCPAVLESGPPKRSKPTRPAFSLRLQKRPGKGQKSCPNVALTRNWFPIKGPRGTSLLGGNSSSPKFEYVCLAVKK